MTGIVPRVIPGVIRNVIRSVVLLLLPLAFASLIVWATAGSSSGSTSDPIFASLWIYLAAHQIPLDLAGSIAGAKLSFLPLGALALVFFAIRSGVTRSLTSLLPQNEDQSNQYPREKRVIVLAFAFIYSIVILLISLISSLRDEVVSIKLYLAFPIALLIALAFSLISAELMPKRSRAPWEIAIAWAAAALALLLAISTLALLISLAIHYQALIDLTTVISPGIFGGLAFLAIQLLYLPNLVAATLGYISGAGAHIGSGSLIHPLRFELDQLPAIPLLASLPRGSFPWAIAGAIIVVALGFFIHRKLRAKFADDKSSAMAVAAFFVLSLFLALLSSGQLITDVLAEVGLSWWRFPLVITGELALGMALSKGSAILKAKFDQRRQARKSEPE